jgi:fructose-1,6-bisphosphatase/inositol monophosphatase family enzyme
MAMTRTRTNELDCCGARMVIKEAGNVLANASGHSQRAGRILFDRLKSYR